MVHVEVKQSSMRSHAFLRKLGLFVTVCVQLWIQGSLTSYAVALREATERHSTLQVNRIAHPYAPVSLPIDLSGLYPLCPHFSAHAPLPTPAHPAPSCGIVWHVCMGNMCGRRCCVMLSRACVA